MLSSEDVERLGREYLELGLIKPYILGQVLVNSPELTPDSCCIDFQDMTLAEAEMHYSLFSLLHKRFVSRQAKQEADDDKQWWRHRRTARTLYDRIAELKVEKVVLKAQTAKAWAFIEAPAGWIYDQSVIVYVSEREDLLHILQSSMHEAWVLKYSSTHETRLRYSPSDVFVNFPLPPYHANSAGMEYQECRKKGMLLRNEGLTAIYNQFNDPHELSGLFVRMRQLQAEIDYLVATAYGWTDLDLGHGFHETPQGTRFTISEPARREVLARLLRLNHERYEEEVRAGLHEKKAGEPGSGGAGGKKGRAKKGGEGQMGLL